MKFSASHGAPNLFLLFRYLVLLLDISNLEPHRLSVKSSYIITSKSPDKAVLRSFVCNGS